MTESIEDLYWSFVEVDKFCSKSGSKHLAKGYKYFIEKYVQDVKGERTHRYFDSSELCNCESRTQGASPTSVVEQINDDIKSQLKY